MWVLIYRRTMSPWPTSWIFTPDNSKFPGISGLDSDATRLEAREVNGPPNESKGVWVLPARKIKKKWLGQINFQETQGAVRSNLVLREG